MRELLRKIICWIYPQLNWLRSKEYDFTKLRSWQSNVQQEEHVKLSPVHLLSNVRIGKYSYIARDAAITNTTIGRFCSIGPNFSCGLGIHPTNGISTAPMFYSTKKQNGITFSSQDKIVEYKSIKIGNDVFIGANVTVLDGVTIGDGAIIGAGAVVSKDIPPYAIAVGSPIEIKRYRMSEKKIAAMERILWWNWEDEKLKDIESMFFDIDTFISKYDK